jgi:hypothetical protein
MTEPGSPDTDSNPAPRVPAWRRRTHEDRLDATIATAQTALKTAVLVNGAGAIALLTLFAGAFKDTNPLPGAAQFAAATLWLVAGTAAAGAATGISFLAQYGQLMRWQSWFGRRRRAAAITQINIVLVFLSYLCFAIAGLHAYWALAGLRGGVFAGPPTSAHELLQVGAALFGLLAAVLWFLAARAGMEPQPAAAPAPEAFPAAVPDFTSTAVPDFTSGPVPDFSSEPARPARLGQYGWSAWAAVATGTGALLQALALMA